MMSAMSSGSWISAVFDEVALEGLEGVTLPSLWILLSERLQIGTPLPEILQQQIWTLLLRSDKKVQFFELPVPREFVPIYNRLNDHDEELGVPVQAEKCPFQRYPYAPVHDGSNMGNCIDYMTRKLLIISELSGLTAAQATEKWGQRLVVVASQEERYIALTPHNVQQPIDLTPQQYVVWEAVGRSRYNGETTVGQWSLLNFVKDANLMFYIKNKLLQLQLITDQPYTEMRFERLAYARLLMLPRFFRIYKAHMQMVIEKLFLELKSRPTGQIPVTELQMWSPSVNKHKSVKRLMTTHAFRKVFENHIVLESSIRKSGKPTERKVSVLQLRNPNMTFDQLYQGEPEVKEEKGHEYLSVRHSYIDMPAEDECLRAIERFGTRGVGMHELSNFVGLNTLTVRGIIRFLLREKQIKDYQEHVGKQRIMRYVSVKQAAQVDEKKDQLKKTLQKLQCKEEPCVTDNADVVLFDVPEIVANVLPLVLHFKSNFLDTNTQRQVQRKSLIVQQIDECCLLPVADLRHRIQEAEKQMGYHDSICHKSLLRLLYTLREAKVLNVYQVTLQHKNQVRVHRLVTHPKIVVDHMQMQRAVLRLKNNFLLNIEDRKQPKNAVAKQMRPRVENVQRKLRVERLGQNVRYKLPKFIVARAMHEFLFYLTRELPTDKKPMPISIELLQHWQRSEPTLMPKEFLEEWQSQNQPIQAFSNEISWRTFITPVQCYDEKPSGWIYFMDAVDRMPLSLFQRIFRLENIDTDRLGAYVKHPVKQHYLMRQLPMELQGVLPRLHQQNLYMNALRLLNNMGLVQVTDRKLGRNPLYCWVYVNRLTTLLDTTSSDCNFKMINPNLKYEDIPFQFADREDVAHYWARLQQICMYTKLGFRSKCDPAGHKRCERIKPLVFLKYVEDFEKAPIDDTGHLPGDHLGAAGLSSVLYAHHFHHWSMVQNKGASSLVVRQKLPKTVKLTMRRTLQKARGKTGRIIKGTKDGTAGKSKSKGPRDDVDRDALKNMRTLRVSWAADEDRVLKLARAISLVIDAPVATFGLFNLGTICRDVIREYLGIRNKTIQACVRRLQFLMKKKRDVPDVTNWVYTIQTEPEFNVINNVNFLDELAREYPMRTEYNEALLVHIVLAMIKLNRLVKVKSRSAAPKFLIPDLLEDYQNQLRECSPLSGDQQLHHSDPTTDEELQSTMVQCVLHSQLCSAKDKTLYNLQAFEIYKNFSESVLNAAFLKARTDGLVVALKRRNIHMISRNLSGPTYLLSSKYKNKLIYVKVNYVVFEAYFSFAKNALKKLKETQLEPNTLKCVELRSPNFAQLFFIGEGLSKDLLRVSLQLPANILTVDTKSMARDSVSGSDRILDHYSSIFDNAPQTEYSKRMESEGSGKQSSRVRFHPGNLNYKWQCSPYDLISKLPQRVMHFFCALNNIGQPLQLNFAKLMRRDHVDGGFVDIPECPFSCIMRAGNYLNAVERIVHEQREILRQLVADTLPQTSIHLLNSGTNTIFIESGTLISLVRQLEMYWREQEQPYEIKDLGKTMAERTLHRLTDLRAICLALLDYDPQMWDADRAKESEPAINKEERARAQDVFVVHLPKIKLQLSAKHEMDVELSKIMEQEMESLNKAVLDKVAKETYWNYTSNTFETLRPLLVQQKYDHQAILHIEDILKKIEQHPLGIMGTELRCVFPLGKFLLEALNLLANHHLIKRVGVANFVYVHKLHIRNWVVHTFHMKRLNRERVVPAEVANTPSLPLAVVNEAKRKRKLVETAEADEQPSTSKKAKLADVEQTSSASSVDTIDDERPRRNRQASGAAMAEADFLAATVAEMSRECIVMRPQPWIRLNATINRRVLDRWLSTLVSECISRNGCTVHSIFQRYPNLAPVDIMLLLELLRILKCIHLMEIQQQSVQVESEYEECREEEVTELYEPAMTYIVTHSDAVGRLSNFIGVKKYNIEFI
ncbi:general transcription factor 3C polypeptide 1 [Scaptodrosophila lebanonensis]|uniref:General transcription factor 3C polypeptide 1 n=1 Tax=Drosophila lebanonensis TaxID=7225 RepID=A0A6J2TP89_DROLE|nr:general transcription factor 3C polypeptide 1 [Scaptodrosophila lebanonensis]